jgi:Protein of unknown function (DUF3617)
MLRFALLFWTTFAFAAGVEPGNWEFTVDVGIQGIGSSSGPQVKTRCISAEEARDPAKMLAETRSSGCEFSNTRDTGSEYTFDVECRGGRVPVKGSGNVRYTPQTMEGQIDLTAEQQNLRIKTRSSVSARRLGPCKP